MKYRKHIRLKGFDYSTEHYYFVTICTKLRQRLFAPRISSRYDHKLPSAVAAGPWPARTIRNTELIEEKILLLEDKFPVVNDFYCIMPAHIHSIIVLLARQGRAATSLAWVINAFKGWGSRVFKRSVWQPNYYEHVIRSEHSLDRLRRYILANPWAEHQEIPWKKLDPVI